MDQKRKHTAPTPEDKQRLTLVCEDLTGVNVNTAWLGDYDLESLELYEAFVMREAAEKVVRENEGIDHNNALLDAQGTAHAIRDTLNVGRRKGDAETPLVVLLITVAERAYKYGVRDAFKGDLSVDCQRWIAKNLDGFLDRRKAMKDFHEELRTL